MKKLQLPENFIVYENTDWYDISYNYQLSEKFIEKYINKLDKSDMSHISYFQKLSEDFIKKYIDRLNLYCLKYNDNVSKKIKRKFGIITPIKTKRLFFRKKFVYA